ncbi:hypothetical protein Taro_001070, partial [Colocasia esculenta]|nr:hypothetical protein [Colocasia esculenta]
MYTARLVGSGDFYQTVGPQWCAVQPLLSMFNVSLMMTTLKRTGLRMMLRSDPISATIALVVAVPVVRRSFSRGCSVSLVVTPGCSFPTSWRSGMLCACAVRLWSHVVAPVFRELLCLGECVPRWLAFQQGPSVSYRRVLLLLLGARMTSVVIWFARAAVGFIIGLLICVGVSRRLREPTCGVAFTDAGLLPVDPVEGGCLVGCPLVVGGVCCVGCVLGLACLAPLCVVLYSVSIFARAKQMLVCRVAPLVEHCDTYLWLLSALCWLVVNSGEVLPQFFSVGSGGSELFEFITYLTGLNANPSGSSDPWVAAQPSGSLAEVRE